MDKPPLAGSDFGGTDRRRLEDELENARVAAEDAREEAAALAAERDALRQELRRRTAALRDAEARLDRPENIPQPTRSAVGGASAEDAISQAEQLRIAMEELQVFAEELEESNAALLRANEELERRVAERTAALSAANERLRDNEERLRLAQCYAGVATWDWDIRTGTIAWSPESLALYGLRSGEIAPSYEAWLGTMLPEDRERVAATTQDYLHRRDLAFGVEYRIRHRQRGILWLACRGHLICDEHGEPARVIGLNIDITARKQAELALEQTNETLRQEVEREVAAREAAQARMFQSLKLEALGQLTGGIAHDFNNLLSVITSGADLLVRTEDPERRARLTEAMAQAARRGADLTRRLLTFARRQALKPEPVDLTAWLGETQELLARSLREDIAVEVAAPKNLWHALVDPGELELAVLNLAVNARDAMPKGGKLRLSAANVTLDGMEDPDGLEGEFVALHVSDTGDGMAPTALAHAFEPFFTTKEAGRGTGLGLAQVYGFARQSGGTARVSSAPGHGTTVTLLLRRATAVKGPNATSAEMAEGEESDTARLHASAGAGPTLRVLLVEDDDDVATFTTEMLQQLGHDVARVASVPAAVRSIEDGIAVDLVFTDVIMPGGADGLDLSQWIAEQRPGLPVLLSSGYSGAPSRVAAAGLTLLRKPYGLEQLRRAVECAARGLGSRIGSSSTAPTGD